MAKMMIFFLKYFAATKMPKYDKKNKTIIMQFANAINNEV